MFTVVIAKSCTNDTVCDLYTECVVMLSVVLFVQHFKIFLHNRPNTETWLMYILSKLFFCVGQEDDAVGTV